MNTIEVSNKGINVKVSVFLYLDTEHPDKDMFIAFCPSLNLVGYGNGEEKAKKDFEWIMKDYLDDMTAQVTLEQDLLNHGWKEAQKTFKEPMVSDMVNTNEQLRNVVNSSNYHKITCTSFA